MSTMDKILRDSTFEQVESSVFDLARMVSAYHKSLMNEGFTREEAFTIVIAWQELVIRMSRNDD